MEAPRSSDRQRPSSKIRRGGAKRGYGQGVVGVPSAKLRLSSRSRGGPAGGGTLPRFFTQAKLGRRLGIATPLISRLEASDREGMITTVNRYLQALSWELTLVAKRKR